MPPTFLTSVTDVQNFLLKSCCASSALFVVVNAPKAPAADVFVAGVSRGRAGASVCGVVQFQLKHFTSEPQMLPYKEAHEFHKMGSRSFVSCAGMLACAADRYSTTEAVERMCSACGDLRRAVQEKPLKEFVNGANLLRSEWFNALLQRTGTSSAICVPDCFLVYLFSDESQIGDADSSASVVRLVDDGSHPLWPVRLGDDAVRSVAIGSIVWLPPHP
mmetsp:Transcript_33945/g.39526  ORF Transcript_33945/g.39526 Transcript_33945/m.39526 type:complete len:218 (+) Transcript_33945:79-732(+)